MWSPKIGNDISSGTRLLVRRGMSAINLSANYDLHLSEVFACLVCGIVFAGVTALLSSPLAAILGGYLMFTMALVVIIDYRHFTIPNVLSLPAIPLGLLAAVSAFPEPALLDHILAAAIAGLFLYGVRAIYWKMRGVEGLGLGDVKLGIAAGAWVGLEALPLTCLLATGAALIAVMIRGRSGQTSMTTPVPLGSFIAPAIAIVWLVRLLTAI